MATINGSNGNDTIDGTNDPDEINANGGDDTVNGRQGADTIYGGDGADTMRGGDQDDLIYGGAGNDSLQGNFDNDTIYGGDGDDHIHGGEQDDVLYGGAGSDTLIGQLGNDVLFGGNDADSLDGGDGADTLYGTVNDTLDGGSGTDQIIVKGPVRVQPQGTTDWYVLNVGDSLDLTGLGNLNGTIEYLDGGGSPTGQTLTYSNSESVSAQSSLPACFAAGTLIDTPQGLRAVETLRAGDLVLTQDRGARPIRWIRDEVCPTDGEGQGKPILIKAGALGPNRPARDLIVSGQHRMLLGHRDQMRAAFADETLVPAKALVGLPGIRWMNGRSRMRWVHFACDRHEIITANGCYAESWLLGPVVTDGISAFEKRHLAGVFGSPAAPDAPLNGPPARGCLNVGKARHALDRCPDRLKSAARHQIAAAAPPRADCAAPARQPPPHPAAALRHHSSFGAAPSRRSRTARAHRS